MIGSVCTDDDDHLFFNYLYNVSKQCLSEEKGLSDDCTNRVLKSLDLDPKQVEHCIDDSFERFGDWGSYNLFLSEDRVHAMDIGIQMNPSLAINSQLYHGDWNPDSIFRAIC